MRKKTQLITHPAPSGRGSDCRSDFRTRYDDFTRYLAANTNPKSTDDSTNARAVAREKLSRLTLQQFYELSTDVYDELARRDDESQDVSFLPPQQEFHPKRNQARQKLALLPRSRFGDLTGDVHFEIERRYPEFNWKDMAGRDSCDEYLASAEGEGEEEEKRLFLGHERKAAATMSMQMARLGLVEGGNPEIEARVRQLEGKPFKQVHSGLIRDLRNLDFKRQIPITEQEYRLLFKLHFEQFSGSLDAYLAQLPPRSRCDSRNKLARLTIQQFHELSSDVYDEFLRRKSEHKAPFLPPKQHLHPKRNQARRKLATLANSRFNDLSGDTHFEILRRYPEFGKDYIINQSGSAMRSLRDQMLWHF